MTSERLENIASVFGICSSTVYEIGAGENWRDA